MARCRVVLMVGALAAALGVGACGGARVGVGPRPIPTAQRVTVDPTGWRVDVPPGWTREHSDSGPGLAEFVETTLANFPQGRSIVEGRTRHGGFIKVRPPLDPTGHFPADGVALRIARTGGGPPFIDTLPDSRFPVHLRTLSRASGPNPDGRLGVPVPLERPVVADDVQLGVSLYLGSQVTALNRRAAVRALASLRFVHPRPGHTVGQLLDLGRPGRFPVGSFTLIHVRGKPAYLIHPPGRLHVPDLIGACPVAGGCAPPGAFYAISSTPEDILGGYRSACHLRLDRRTEAFACTNSTARWDRAGRPLVVPRGARQGDGLNFLFVKLGWDGQLLLNLAIGGNPPRATAYRALWP